jgi:hypothetical protein
MSETRISQIGFELVELPTRRDNLCPTHERFESRLAQSEEQQGKLLGSLADLKTTQTEHGEILKKLDSRVDEQVQNHASLTTTLLASSRSATWGGAAAGLVGTFEAIRAIAHAMGWG